MAKILPIGFAEITNVSRRWASGQQAAQSHEPPEAPGSSEPPAN